MMRVTAFIPVLLIFSCSFCFAETGYEYDEEISPEEESYETSEETTTNTQTYSTTPNLIGPAGVTGTIRRSDRRQDRRLENDLEDALERRRLRIQR